MDLGIVHGRTKRLDRPRPLRAADGERLRVEWDIEDFPGEALIPPLVLQPLLEKLAGKIPSRDLTTDVSSPTQLGWLLPSPFKFARHGQSGMEIAEVMPHLAGCVDDIALIRSMYGEHFNHEPALFQIHSGRTIPGRPSLGSWVDRKSVV